MNRPPLQQFRGYRQVIKPPIGAGTKKHLVNLDILDLCHRRDIIDIGRTGDERRQVRNINLHDALVLRVTRGQHGIHALGSPLEPILRDRIGCDQASFAAHLNRHIAEGEAFAHGHTRNNLSRVLDGAIIGSVHADLAHNLQGHIFGIDAEGQRAGEMHIDRRGDAEPGTPGSIGNGNIGRAHAGGEGSQRAISTGMAIAAHDDRARGHKAALRHDLVADTLLQNGYPLLTGEATNIAMQRGSGNGSGGNNMVEHDMRAVGIEDAPASVLRQLAKSLDCQRRRSIMAHHMIDIHHHRLSLLHRTAQFVAKNFFR